MNELFERYGIRFIKINETHLETVRNWRNSDFVKSRMLFQQEISPEMQLKWFHTINNDKNYFFIVEYMSSPVGVANIKDIEGKQGEPGFYLIDEKYKDTNIASLVNVAFGDFLFEILELEKLYIHVRKDNADALKLNLFFGYKIIEDKCADDFYYLELDKEIMMNNKRVNNLRNYMKKNIQL